MNRVPTLTPLALVAFSLTHHPLGGNGLADSIHSAVYRAAAPFMENQRTVGLSIAILKGGQAYAYHFGTTERGKQHPPTARTLYAIGSLTKTFTGALLAQAVAEKKLSLDDDVRQHLGSDYPNLEYQGKPVRLWQLINHTSGLPFSLPEAGGLRASKGDAAERSAREAAVLEKYTREDFLRDLHRVKLSRVPGERFSYSNSAAQLLGLVLEQVYGQSYEALVRSKITGPLKMNDTKVTLSFADMARFPKGYSASGAFRPYLSSRFPAAGSLKSTTADMLKYMAWNLAEIDAAVKLSHDPAGSTVWSQDGSYSVGLGWQILRSSGKRRIFQDGTVPGFHSVCVMYPELNLGIIVLSNEEDRSDPTNLSSLVEQILTAIDPRVAAASGGARTRG